MFYGQQYPSAAVSGLYGYLFCSLASMSAARIVGLSGSRGGRIPRFGPGWMAAILASALSVVGLAVLAGWMASSRIIQIVTYAVIAMITILTAVLLLILSPLLSLLAQFLPKIADMLQQLLARLLSLPVSQQLARLANALSKGFTQIVPYLIAARGLLLTGLLIGLAIFILLALYFHRRRRPLAGEEQIDAAGQNENQVEMNRLLQHLLQAVRGIGLRSPVHLLAAARIRQIYRQLMRLTKKMGVERPPSRTPLEFLQDMARLFPGEENSLNLITQSYLKVRYGEYLESRNEVASVEIAWKRIRQEGSKAVNIRKKKIIY
jgi:hypothetical protein